MEKKQSFARNTVGSEELNIFTGINFRKSDEVKYFAVPNFHEFAKNETLFRENFLLQSIILIIFTICMIKFWIHLTFDWSSCYMTDIPQIPDKK